MNKNGSSRTMQGIDPVLIKIQELFTFPFSVENIYLAREDINVAITF